MCGARFNFRSLESNHYSDDRYEVPSSSGDTTYEVWKSREDGRWVCGCPHFIFRTSKTGTYCKHIKKLIDDIEVHNNTMNFIMENTDWSCDWDAEIIKYRLF